MAKTDLTIRIGGEAGQGVESSGAGFTTALSRGGLHVFTDFDYHSRIRGGHNFADVRISDQPLWAPDKALHILLALTQETVDKHLDQVLPGGAVIYEEEWGLDPQVIRTQKLHPCPIPLRQIAVEVGGSEVMANTAALATAAGVMQYDLDFIVGVIEDNFAAKGPAVVEGNRKVAQKAYALTRERHPSPLLQKLERQELPRRIVLNGNQAFAMGALRGGCQFVSAYPMTPGSPVLEWLVSHAEAYGLVTVQVEDEIAALCMAIGASLAGVRALSPTSGGGFALMVEALGLAGMLEVPVVIYEAQRPGPSTGLPTRTEQADLLFVLRASQGEFPRIVLAPGTLEQSFEAGWRAFNLAEKYQCPVIVLSDHFLASSLRDLPPEALGFFDARIERGDLLSDADLDALEGTYKRHALTESGISPRAIPGHPKGVYATASDEHDEYGHIEEDAENRRLQTDKRMRKLERAVEEMRPPALYGPDEAEVTFVGWGSTYGPLREAVDRLNAAGERVNMLHFVDIWPFPAEAAAAALDRTVRTIAVEGNSSGQLADLIQAYTGHRIPARILKYDGRPFTPDFILDHYEEV